MSRCALQRRRPPGRVNRKVIEKRSVHVTAVYSVHSPFICRFSWILLKKGWLGALCTLTPREVVLQWTSLNPLDGLSVWEKTAHAVSAENTAVEPDLTCWHQSDMDFYFLKQQPCSDCQSKSVFWPPDWFSEVWTTKKDMKCQVYKSDPSHILGWFEMQ